VRVEEVVFGMWRTTTTALLHRRLASELVLSNAQRSTIYALSTPPGKAGIAVVRVSGPDALHVWQSMVTPLIPEPYKMVRCRITHPHTHQLLDDALAVFFKGNHHSPTFVLLLNLSQVQNHSQPKMS
jgi:tRNA modification GTPase